MQQTLLISALVLALAACGPSEQAAAPATATAPVVEPTPAQVAPPVQAAVSNAPLELSAILSGAHRTPENQARDKYRHPNETLSFFGVQASNTVLEITPGGGWYAEILAPLLKDGGRYIAALNDPALASSDRAKEYVTKQNDALAAKFAGAPDHYSKAETVLFDGKMANFGPAGSADVVLTFRNAHNWIGQGSADSMFKGAYEVLKPGGVLGVTDHRAAEGTAFNAESGYVTEADIIKLAETAGFKLEAKSEVNANPKDTRDHESGVWTLPPSLALKDKDREKYLAIGESDRMTLKFLKPAQ